MCWLPPKVLVFPARLLLLWRLMEAWGVSGVPWSWGLVAGCEEGALEHWNNEKGCMVNVSQGDDVFGSNLGYNRLILVNAC